MQVQVLLGLIVAVAATEGHAASITSVALSDSRVPQYGRVELAISLDAAYENPYDAEEIEVLAVCYDPGGRS